MSRFKGRFLGLAAAFFIALLLLPLLSFAAEDGTDITKKCKIKMPGGAKSRNAVTDGYYKTVWQLQHGKSAKIRITLPEGVTEGGLYVCWGRYPENWTLEADGAEAARHGDTSFYHEYIPFTASKELVLNIQAAPKRGVMIGELNVISGKEPPAWVQRWEKPYEEADLMVLVAHPDDELLFMGGAIPYYEKVAGKRVQVCYLTCANNMRRSELLNGLWSLGLRHYPDIGRFQDKAFRSRANLYNSWNEKRAREHVVELLRKYRPQVLISHDKKGEYGHVAHKVCSDLAVYAAKHSGDARVYPKSAAEYGAWTLPKIYLHLYPENKIELDWKQPQDVFGGKTALEMAEAAFKLHRSQQKNHYMGKSAVYNTERFGLVESNVGADVEKNDFFENIPPR